MSATAIYRSTLTVFACGALAAVSPRHVFAQSDARARADSLVRDGDLAANDSRPRAAIDAYERAIAVDPSRRVALLPRLGRQYLWSDAPREAARLFTDYLATNPTSCETKLDLGLALSWADELDAARATYDTVATNCLYERGQARLGAARAARWGNHFSDAERRYRAVLADGSDADREQAAIGLAYVRLARAEPRAALALADSLLATGSHDPSLTEARIMALADLGALGGAVDAVREARAAGRGSASMDRLARGYEERARATFAGGVRGFRDHDGTSYRAVDVASGAAPLAFGAIRVTARAAELRDDSVRFESREAETSLDVRPARSLALSGRVGLKSYEAVDFTPWEGEVNVAWLPGDHHRVDLSAARLIIGDNMAAIEHQLVGAYGSVGLTERLTSRLSTALSVDATHWSEGNTRFRVRATPRLALEGVPSVTFEWPTIYQRYSAPFEFRFFSPREYLETGPAVNVYRRVASVWYLSGYARAGGLRESGRSWQTLGMGRASVEREIRAHWGVRLDAAWSNSNLAGSAGFQRTSFGAGVTIRP
jgi:tetratricopeptide (TPR) repeat protein